MQSGMRFRAKTICNMLNERFKHEYADMIMNQNVTTGEITIIIAITVQGKNILNVNYSNLELNYRKNFTSCGAEIIDDMYSEIVELINRAWINLLWE